jgi:ELWxxDGT repeat protein
LSIFDEDKKAKITNSNNQHIMQTFFRLWIFLFTNSIFAQTPMLVKDILPGADSGVVTITNAGVAGNSLYFSALDPSLGEELWITDGTEAGTMLVKDIYPGIQGSRQKFYTAYNGQVYFTAFNPTNGTELWRTDDIEGAIMAGGDVLPGPASGADYSSSSKLFAEYDGKLIFQLNRELWVSDGSPAGTMLLKDINPGPGAYSYPFGFVEFKGKLYFAADSADLGTELWVTDGTSDGTRLVKNINPAPFASSRISAPVAGPDAIYFWATDNNNNGPELWKSDGTPEGTVRLKEIRPGPDSGQPGYFGFIPMTNSVWVGNNLLFSADDGDLGPELWITDGTEAGTQLLLDIRPGVSGSSIQFFGKIGGKAIFRAGSSSGQELWVSDGTVSGTHLVKDINAGTGSGMLGWSVNSNIRFIIHEDKMYFTANDGSTGAELWVTDGTEVGTKLVYDLNPGIAESTPSNFQIMGDYLYFFATTEANGTELWQLPLQTSSTSDLENHLDIKIYPTLSTDGVFHLQYGDESATVLDVQVFNAVGNLVHRSEHSASQSLHLSTLPSGSYFIRVTTTDGRFSTQKVVIGR